MIVGGNMQHGHMIARAAFAAYDPAIDQCISRISKDNRFLGGVIFTNYTGSMVMMHMAGIAGWASPELVWSVFDHAFNRMGVTKVVGTVRSDNRAACEQDERLGFVLEHEIADGIPGGTLRIYSMPRTQCRWLRMDRRYKKLNGHAGDRTYVHIGSPAME